jgi:hypothetical protein
MKKTAPTESKSLKTFFLYVFIVIIIVCVSLVIKGIFIIQQSKFDSSHDFILAITKQEKVKQVIAFHPEVPALSVLTIQDANIPYWELSKNYGITPDGYIQVSDDTNIGTDITTLMWSTLLHTADWQCNITIFDKIRLMLLSKAVTTNNKTVETISLLSQDPSVGTTVTNALTDQSIADENISIQIINATEITGFGQRLSRVLTNIGANVVDVSTAQNIQDKSTIQYYGDSSYTVDRLQKLLGIQATQITKQPIANIVITLGTDKRNTTAF